MLGDTTVAVHPDSEGALNHKIKETIKELAHVSPASKPEYEKELTELEKRKKTLLPELIKLRDMAKAGRKVMLPLLNRPIPLIMDE